MYGSSPKKIKNKKKSICYFEFVEKTSIDHFSDFFLFPVDAISLFHPKSVELCGRTFLVPCFISDKSSYFIRSIAMSEKKVQLYSPLFFELCAAGFVFVNKTYSKRRSNRLWSFSRSAYSPRLG